MTSLTHDIQAARSAPACLRRPPARWTIALTPVVLAAMVVLLVALGQGGRTTPASPAVSGPPDAPFEVEYPRNWRALGEAQRLQLPGQPLAVLRRADGQGTVIVAKRAPLTTPLEQLPAALERKLGRRFPDFREIGAKVVRLGDSPALVYTFARTKTGAAQSLVVVPSGDHSFTLNAVVAPHAPEAAREVGAILATFRPTGAR